MRQDAAPLQGCASMLDLTQMAPRSPMARMGCFIDDQLGTGT